MNNIMVAKELVANGHSDAITANNKTGQGQHTKYLDKEYITRARQAEVKQHLNSIGQLQRKMEKLSQELAWELEQHHSKIHELYQLETPFRKIQESGPVKNKPSKKTSTRTKSRQVLSMPLIGESLCETFA